VWRTPSFLGVIQVVVDNVGNPSFRVIHIIHNYGTIHNFSFLLLFSFVNNFLSIIPTINKIYSNDEFFSAKIFSNNKPFNSYQNTPLKTF